MIVIIGAGISGLTVATELGPSWDYVVLEKENNVGGLSTTYESNGFWFDFAGHYFHFPGNSDIKTFVEHFCALNTFDRKSKTFLLNRYIPFPVQFNLSHLPSALKRQIAHEIIDNKPGAPYADNLHDFLKTHFGKTLFQLFFKPFLTKYYHVDLKTLATDMDKGSIPVPDKNQVMEGVKGKTFSKTGYNPVFYYPEPSLKRFIDNYSLQIKDRIHLNEEAIEIDCDQKIVKTQCGSYHYDKLATSMPLNRLLDIIKPAGRFPLRRLLKYASTLLVNVILKKKRKRFHWVYLAEEKFPFYRVGLYAGRPDTACYLERNVIPGAVIDKEKLNDEVIFTLKELKLIESGAEIVHLDARIIPVAYVIFDHHWAKTVPPLLDDLRKIDIYSIGRYGSWNYSFMSNDIAEALRCADEILGSK